ncbi:hypothetical protein MANES_14G039700v8 [Manihot esculenta]|uniref:Uncharacterized protein n=1 Tax=Manihot esculenta TaxID=3983 RepID=A0ACB7GDY3_MANES|nr:hypothetical protein MANES_14G039700v8 [Manihot esculenta]
MTCSVQDFFVRFLLISMEGDLKSSSSFTIGNTAQETGLSYLPDCYVFPPSHRPSLAPEVANVPIIDFAMLKQNPGQRAQVIRAIGNACRRLGYFQIINHGICPTTLEGALSAASDYFELPMEEKIKLMSNDVRKPVRYGTSIRDGTDKFQFWRVFLKHYAYPLSDWLDLWPNNPPHYREKMGKYCQEARKLALELMAAITESLGLGPTYLGSKMEEGVHVMAVNCYPPCPKPDMALGLPPHSDYSCLTILLQSSPGLEIMDPEDGKWKAVPDQLHGTLQVQVGDHVESWCR